MKETALRMTLTARQKRILAALATGDLVWEVPHEDFFTQYNEKTGRPIRVRHSELETMRKCEWIERISHDPTTHKLDYWQLTAEGREMIEGLQRPLSSKEAALAQPAI